MASRAWTEPERDFLKTLAGRRDWIDDAMQRFHDRSEAAVRCMMQKVRAEMGYTEQRFFDNAWMADAANGTAMLLDRLQVTGLRP